MINYIKKIILHLKNPNKKSLEMSLNDVHKEGLFSLVIDGTEPGKLTRVFIANKKVKPFDVQLHSHRYPIKLTVIKGKVVQHEAIECTGKVEISKYSYKSFLNGGEGLEFIDNVNVHISDYVIPIGSQLIMSEKDIHTISCSKKSIWIVEELGFKVDESVVLGVPFNDDGLYNEPAMFQVNDNCQLVKNEINKIIQSYEIN